jgi:hypothetical protein
LGPVPLKSRCQVHRPWGSLASGANSLPHRRRDTGSRSRFLVRSEAQTRSVKCAMFGVPQVGEVRYHDAGNGPQPPDCCSRFVEPSQMGVAGREIPMRVGEARIFLDR